MIFKVFLLFLSSVLCQNQYKGDVCYKDGVAGVCLSLGQCKTAQEDIQNRRYPQLCSYENNTPVVCCVKKNPGKPVKPTRPPVQENVEAQCEPMPEEYSPPKTGQKAFDKCIEYQQKHVYPCERGVDILGSFSRQIRCHHKTDELIIGGIDAEQYEFPHMVMLGFGPLRSIEWLCGGAIISERFVLSAGHCISRSKNDPVTYIVVGALKRTDANDQSKIYKVKNVIEHPLYKSPSRYNDIALIETERMMELDQFTVPACLHTGDFVNDTRVIAAGWGLTHDKGEHPSDTLKRVILTKFSELECSQAYQPFRLMEKGFDGLTQSCYGDRDPPSLYRGREEYKDTCQGDSGGPIQIKDQKIHCMYTIVGVTSVGKASCGNGHKPAIYTRVAQYLPWIENIVWSS